MNNTHILYVTDTLLKKCEQEKIEVLKGTKQQCLDKFTELCNFPLAIHTKYSYAKYEIEPVNALTNLFSTIIPKYYESI